MATTKSVARTVTDFIRSAEKKVTPEDNLFEYICKGIGIINGETKKATLLKGKVDSSLPKNLSAAEKRAYKLFCRIIEVVDANPQIKIENAHTVKELLSILEQESEPEDIKVRVLPEDYLKQLFHIKSNGPRGIFPSIYYNESGVLTSDRGCTESWEKTGILYIDSKRTLDEYLSLCDDSVYNVRTSAFGNNEGKFNTKDLVRAFRAISKYKVPLSTPCIIFLKKSVAKQESVAIDFGGTHITVFFDEQQVGSFSYSDGVHENINAFVVNLAGYSSAGGF